MSGLGGTHVHRIFDGESRFAAVKPRSIEINFIGYSEMRIVNRYQLGICVFHSVPHYAAINNLLHITTTGFDEALFMGKVIVQYEGIYQPLISRLYNPRCR